MPASVVTIRRAPRYRVADSTPAVMHVPDGRRATGELQLISRTGGLLCLAAPIQDGCVVELEFETHKGPVLGTAQMLVPVTSTEQPFRFVALTERDQRTLYAAFQSRLFRNIEEEEWIEELSAAVMNSRALSPRRWLRKSLLVLAAAAIVFATIYLYLDGLFL
jgi:hypothetical protein